MARYELGSEFWDIAQDGVQLVIIAGVVGSHGKRAVRKFISADHAGKQLAKLVAEKLAAGYREVDRQTDEPEGSAPAPGSGLRHPELEQAIELDPKDEQAYSVYADWLQAQGHPRGELIALQLAEEANPDDKRLAAASRKFLAANADVLVGKLAEYMRRRDGTDDGPLIWRFGFVHRIELDAERDEAWSPADVIGDVLRHPSGRLVAEISIRDDAHRVRAAVAQLGKLAPRALRSLALMSTGDFGDLRPLAAIPRLARLVVKSRANSFSGNDGDALSKRCVQSIVKATWPLEALELRFGGSATFRDLEPLFRRTDLAALRELRLRGPRFADEICGALVESPLAGQLVALELGMAELDDTSVQLVLAHRARFAKLRELGVARSLVTPKLHGMLRAAFERVVDASSDPDDYEDDEEYYDEVEE